MPSSPISGNPRDDDGMPPGADVRALLVRGFKQALATMHDGLFTSIHDLRAEELGSRAARAAVAPALWAAVVADCFDTGQLAGAMGVSRRTLATRVARGLVVGLPGRGTTRYPAWQFDLDSRPMRVKPVVTEILAAWQEECGSVDAYAVVAWAVTRQPELSDQTPLQVMDNPGREWADRVVLSAWVTAAALSQ